MRDSHTFVPAVPNGRGIYFRKYSDIDEYQVSSMAANGKRSAKNLNNSIQSTPRKPVAKQAKFESGMETGSKNQ